jgi:hypothetical protein
VGEHGDGYIRGLADVCAALADNQLGTATSILKGSMSGIPRSGRCSRPTIVEAFKVMHELAVLLRDGKATP